MTVNIWIVMRLPARLRVHRFLRIYCVFVSIFTGVRTSVGKIRFDSENDWHSSVDLSLDEGFRLSWKSNPTAVIFMVEAKTKGYFGFGFSEDGHMSKADLIVGWINDVTEKPFIVDCYGGETNSLPIRDPTQNVDLLGGYQNASHTVVTFTRSWDTCDRLHDHVIPNDTVKVIWSMDDTDPLDESLFNIRWHGNERRGSRSLHLKNPPAKLPPNNIYHYWDVTLSNFVTQDNMDTVYWCKIFKPPRLPRKHHIVGFSPILKGQNPSMIRHMVLYECGGKSQQMEMFAPQGGMMCYSEETPPEWSSCITPVAAWAAGSEGEYLPPHVGIPFSEDGTKYYMLVMHYDNPTLKRVNDNSGLRIYYTENLRKYDGGIFVTGVVISPLHIVAPFQKDYKTAGYCDKYCTNAVLPQGGINSVSVGLHAHTAARKLKLRHFRQGEELRPIVQDEHYDFNYQQSHVLSREVTIFPGDEIVTECSYNTVNRSQPTQGGYSTKQEMCLSFVTYYPRVPLSSCQSISPVSYFFHSFGVKQFYNYDMPTVEKMLLKLGDKHIKREIPRTATVGPKFPIFPGGTEADEKINEAAILALKKMAGFTLEELKERNILQDLVIASPPEFKDKTFLQHLQDLPWKENVFTQNVEELFYRGKHLTFCVLKNDTLALPLSTHIFPNVTPYLPTYEQEARLRCSIKNKQPSEVNKGTGPSFLKSTLILIFISIFWNLSRNYIIPSI